MPFVIEFSLHSLFFTKKISWNQTNRELPDYQSVLLMAFFNFFN